MNDSLITDACLDSCKFIESDLRNIEYGRNPDDCMTHGDNVYSIAFSPDGKYLASGSGDKTVKLWNVESQKEVNTLKKHKDKVTSVAFSPDGKYMASGSYDHTVKLWSVQP
jgi:WD40 repeat protein